MAASSAFISFPILLYEGWVLLASVDGLFGGGGGGGGVGFWLVLWLVCFPPPPPPVGVSLVEVTLATTGAGFVLVASPRSEPSFC